MDIKDHKIVGVPFKRSPNQAGNINPKLIIIHYTAASTTSSAINWMLNPKSQVSAQIHIARDGGIMQLVEFDKRAFHAGKSTWKGVSDLNWHSIGIELQNTGSENYTQVQLDVLVEVCKALVKEYNIPEIVGHSDVSPGRKVDPGKQFPWGWFRSQVFEKDEGKMTTLKTTANLNLRTDAGTRFPSIRILTKGTEVNVLSEKDGWSEVFICESKVKGWVSSEYIK